MAEAIRPIHTSPRTESQLRAILDRLKKSQETLVTDLGELEDRVIRTGTADGAVSVGDVLYPSSSGGVDQAQANAAATSVIAGISLNAAGIGEDVIYLVFGAVTLTGPLTAGVVYYLSPTTPGAITATAPTTVGYYVVSVGRALTTTELLFSPLSSVLL